MPATSPAQTARLRQLFRYLPQSHGITGQETPWLRTSTGDNNQPQSTDTFTYNRIGGGEAGIYEDKWDINPDSWLAQINNELGLNARVEQDLGSEARPWQLSMDYSKLPRTRLGGIEELIPVEDYMRSRLINPQMVVNDPNYGLVTRRENLSRPNAWVGPALMAIASMGAGSIAPGIGTASTLMRTGSNMIDGRFNPMQLAQLALGAFGGPQFNSPWARMLMNFGQQAVRNRRRRGGRP